MSKPIDPKAAALESGGAAAVQAIPAAFADRCREASCRSCGRGGLQPILDLGPMPIVGDFHQPDAAPAARHPLELARCEDCTLVQIIETVPPEVLFTADYPYHASWSDSWVAHCRELAEKLIDERGLGSESLVVELASNDGYMLSNFVARGVPALGIDPAAGPVAIARARGVPSLCAFFGRELAQELRDSGRRADVILGLNVLAHVADTNGFLAGVRTLLADDGAAVFEFPYVRDMIDRREFDTIYHEHLCYFSGVAIDRLLARHDLHFVDVERVPTHGGSLRVTAAARPGPRPRVEALLAEEREWGVDGREAYQTFATRTTELLTELHALLRRLKSEGATIAAYGAPAKGVVLLSAMGVDPGLIDFVVDRNPHKQGRVMPGLEVAVDPPSRVLDDQPDYVLLLPWNLEEEILQQQAEYRRRGGKFIVPLPSPRIV